MGKIRDFKISHIYKDDMRICSARVIFATLVDEVGNEHRIEWLSGPAVERREGFFEYKETKEFTEAWNKAEVGMKVKLYPADGTNQEHFLISEF